MPRPKQLDPSGASRTLLSRLGGKPGKLGVVDRVRQIATKLGDRPYNVDLVWVRWTGVRIGIGTEDIEARVPVVPNPVVTDLTAVTHNPYSAGILPVGTVRVSEVSPGQYSDDLLRGFILPDKSPRPANVEFFWELRFDGRNTGIEPTQRARFRVLGTPFYDADNLQVVCLLERASEDPSRLGTGLPALPGGRA
jgi:hypothetical protein